MQQNEYGETALIISAKIGNTICIEHLLELSSQLNNTDNNGYTALIHAVKSRQIECVKKLIAAGADINKGTVPPLISSIRSKCFDCTNELLRAGADVNSTCEGGNTALIEAVCCGKNTIVQSLLLKGADVNAENTKGCKAIHLAAERSHQEFKRQQSFIETNEKEGKLTSCTTESASQFANSVNMCLRGVTISNNIGGFNPQRIDLEPPEYQKLTFIF